MRPLPICAILKEILPRNSCPGRSSQIQLSVRTPPRDDFVIAILLLGPSPTGNTTIISHLLPSNTSPEPIPTPPPPTTAIASYAADLPNGQCVLLLDTPGFDPSAPFSTRWGVEVVTYISALHARNKSRVCWGGTLLAFDVLREVVDEKKRLADTNLGELLSAALEERERNVKDTLAGAERQIVVRSGEASEGALDFWVRWKGDLEVEIGRVDEERQILDMRLKEMLRASRTGWDEEGSVEVAREKKRRRFSFDWWRQAF
ncbi:hypothetical protein PSPO01_03110 [Paraphaeosphaeria sporulosa]